MTQISQATSLTVSSCYTTIAVITAVLFVLFFSPKSENDIAVVVVFVDLTTTSRSNTTSTTTQFLNTENNCIDQITNNPCHLL